MKSEVQKTSSLGRKVNIHVPAAVVKTVFDRIFQSIQKDAEIKGFRKGKAPIATIKSMYGERVKQDVVQELIQMHYPKALSEHKLEPMGYPEFDFDQPNEMVDFTFTASFDVRPEVNLKKYEGLEVEKEKLTTDEKKVDEVLQNIRNSRATLVDVLEDRPSKFGDTAVVDFEGFVDGKPLENGKGENHNLELGSKSFIEGFEEGITGMKVGETRTLSLKFPDPYHAPELAGKPVEFKTTLKGLKKKELPELNDEFVKTLGGPTDLEDLKKQIRQDIEEGEKKRVEDAFKNRLLKKLVENNPVEVPASLMQDQKQSLIQDFQKRMSDQGMSNADFESYVQKWDKDFENTASEMIQSSFLIDEIARKHDLIAKKEDIDAKLAEYAAQTGIDEARLREFYGRSEQLNRLAYMITEEKVISHLLKTAKVKEVSADQLKETQQ
jgi:trigger factor